MRLTLAQWVLLGGVDLGTKLMQLQNRKYTKTVLNNKMVELKERYTDCLPPVHWGDYDRYKYKEIIITRSVLSPP